MSEPLGQRRARAALVGGGAALVAVGAWQFLADVPVASWWHVVRWAALAVLVHDLLLAPAAALLGVLVLRQHPGGGPALGRWRAAPRAALWRGLLLLATSLGAVVWALHLGAADPRNATVTPHGWLPGALVALAVVLAVLAVGVVAGRPGGRRTGPTDRPRAAS